MLHRLTGSSYTHCREIVTKQISLSSSFFVSLHYIICWFVYMYHLLVCVVHCFSKTSVKKLYYTLDNQPSINKSRMKKSASLV